MRNYESVIIVRPSAGSEAELTGVIDKYSGVITAHEGEIGGVDRWGLKKLAYPISKETQGVYLLFRYTTSPDGIKELERLLRIDDRILKFLTVKLTGEEAPFTPSEDEGGNGDEEAAGDEAEGNDNNEDNGEDNA
ncbi:30S ribosomal protein S6 [Desulfurivibrio alkaliphilus]|uniref:Small ribosomal subunit protein bS6 n=1 Tax=Desulfurivibrio alkaliphilus (strain DSM 19089 / UNIQEM U267 / AHT2) TaxID=589865 RepID=D6Z2S0_DESAT|nr:30S ribosomal protein S6 [Desulfurivibrio alkaliphilus]ADH85845.1 ribosomal protein S6 [Desulfurivibrio alkaliphilus AHT 2]